MSVRLKIKFSFESQPDPWLIVITCPTTQTRAAPEHVPGITVTWPTVNPSGMVKVMSSLPAELAPVKT